MLINTTMFQRRTPKSRLLQLKNLFWPCMGWDRLASYYQHRVGRMKGSPYNIAAGFACGVAASFTPLIGLHFLLSLFLAFLVRGSLVASIFGTFIGNPWTFPLIWIMVYKIGIVIWPDAAVAPGTITDMSIADMLFTAGPKDIFLPMVIGSIPCAIIAWTVSFFVMRDLVATYQDRRRKRMERKAEKRAQKRKTEDKSS